MQFVHPDLNFFSLNNGVLAAEGVDLAKIAQDVGTPCYVYSRAGFEAPLLAYQEGLKDRKHLICYAIKANPCGALLRLAAALGAGADVTSGGELAQASRAGIPPEKIVFSGVAKTAREINEALDLGIFSFNIESESELDLIDRLALERNQRVSISFRVNPDIDAKTHPKITTGMHKNKFGIPTEQALELARSTKKRAGVVLTGLDCHIGSGLPETGPLLEALQALMQLRGMLENEGLEITHLDIGGGLGIQYTPDQNPAHPREYAKLLADNLQDFDGTIIVEPGRSISGNAGVLLSSVVHTKDNGKRRFVIIDAAMTDLVRPAMYEAKHEILVNSPRNGDSFPVDVVGGVCESSDTFARDCALPPMKPGDLLAFCSAGAYGFAMSSQYNGRPRVPEVLVEGDTYRVVRRRETYEDLWAAEIL